MYRNLESVSKNYAALGVRRFVQLSAAPNWNSFAVLSPRQKTSFAGSPPAWK
jgi:hypothetical protein